MNQQFINLVLSRIVYTGRMLSLIVIPGAVIGALFMVAVLALNSRPTDTP